ncbi:acetyltransferase [Ureibacillus aquaedulcis]|uniref:Acetyltransferase n=1 Tax=Ureibacillus aquaedulcis TaxID=3058421 RepID=A0ABT8GQV8_9BACL|nr:acetyltransferase [Ureibacillus sp. BA0131]MDN4493793.1 acetyltransferase [Ureibacillus sp. BA0131]
MLYSNCTHCNSTKIQEGVIRAANAPLRMYPEESFTRNAPLNAHLRKSSAISSYYCQECGCILGLFLTEPKNLD